MGIDLAPVALWAAVVIVAFVAIVLTDERWKPRT